jgi:cytochrome P450
MRVRDAEGQPLPFARLWSELSIFFLAGMETTAHAITWAL